MAQVIITINYREYAISCENGGEAQILKLGNLLDRKAKELTNALGQINENQLLAMVGLLVADELSELKKQTPSQTPPTDFSALDEELSASIKSLNDQIKSVATNLKIL